MACAQRAQPQNGDETEDQIVRSLLLGWGTVSDRVLKHGEVEVLEP